jgi:hypothetical protein
MDMARMLKLVLALQAAGLACALLLHNGEVTASGLLLVVITVALLLPGSVLAIVAERLTHWSPHLPPRLESLLTAAFAVAINLALYFACRRFIATRRI